jgi:hypothetical protein
LSFLSAILQVAFINDYYIDLFHLRLKFNMESISSWTGITLKPDFPQGHLFHGGLHKRASLPLNRVTVQQLSYPLLLDAGRDEMRPDFVSLLLNPQRENG